MNRVGFQALKWPFQSGNFDKEIGALERHKTTVTMVLSNINAGLIMDVKQGVEVR